MPEHQPQMVIKRFARMMPRPVRRLLGIAWDHVWHMRHWVTILSNVHGVAWRDRWVIVLSALAGTVTGLRQFGQQPIPLLLMDARVSVKEFGRFHLRRGTDDLWHVLPGRESDVMRAIQTCLKPGDVFVDAGANIGIYTLMASRIVGSMEGYMPSR